ncbi:Talin-1 [Chytridiales sp. JEL 0842]|nr:Talin-1 [Chytridiales sp. JEL 0842]
MTTLLSLRIVDADTDATKTIQLAGDLSVHEACQEIKEKFGNSAGNDHGLFWPDSGKWLVPNKVLDFYDIKSGDTLMFKKRHRPLKVKTLDDSMKMILVDESLSVAKVVEVVCQRFGIQNPEEYSFVPDTPALESPTTKGSPTKKPSPLTTLMSPSKGKPKDEDEPRWLNPDISLPEQGLTEVDVVILKKKFFFTDQNIDRNDPVQLNLLYNQAREMIISGKHPCTYEEASQFAAFQCQVQFGNHEPDKHKPGFIKLKDFVPPEYRNNKDLSKKIFTEHGKLQGLSELNAKFRYVQLSRSLKTYGITFFNVKEKHAKKNKFVDILLGVTKNSIVRLDVDTKDIIKSWPLTQLRRWAAASNTFTLDFGDYADSYYVVQTPEGEQISQLISGYIEIILKKRKDAEKTVPIQTEQKIAVEEYVRPAKATAVGIASVGQRQAAEKKIGTVMSATKTRVGISQPVVQYVTSPTNFGSDPEKSGAHQGLIRMLRNSLAVISSASNDLDAGIVIPPLGNDPASIQWKQNAINSNAESTASQIASNLSSFGSIVNLSYGDPGLMDFENVGLNVSVVTTNYSHMSNGLKMLSALTDDPNDKDSLLEAARAIGRATNAFLNSLLSLILGEATKEQIYTSAHVVSIAHSDMLALIGRLEVLEDSQNDLVGCARSVAHAVTEVVANIKRLSESVPDQQLQLVLASNAKGVAEAANQIVACATIVAPVVSVQFCLDQMMEASVLMQDALARLQESVSLCADSADPQSVHDVCQNVETAIAMMIEKARQLGDQYNDGPLDAEYDQVIMSMDNMLDNISTTDGIIVSAKDLTLSATQYVNALKKGSLETTDESERERLLLAARSLADATSKMVGAAKDAARYPTDQERQIKLQKAINDIQVSANDASGPRLQQKVFSRLGKSLKTAMQSQSQLVVAARNAAASNRNQASQIQLNQIIKKINELAPAAMSAVKGHHANPDDPMTRTELFAAAKQIVPEIAALIAAAKVAAPTASEAYLQTHLLGLAQQAASDLQQLEKATLHADEASTNLQMESALCRAETICTSLQLDASPIKAYGADEEDETDANTAQVQLVVNSKDLQGYIGNLIAATSRGDKKAAGSAANEAMNALQSASFSVSALKTSNIQDDYRFGINKAALQVGNTLSALIEAAKLNLESQSEALPKEELAKLAQSASQAVDEMVSNLPVQKELAKAISAVELFNAQEKPAEPDNQPYALSQSKLEASVTSFMKTSNTLSTALRGSAAEIQVGTQAFVADFQNVMNAVRVCSWSSNDENVSVKLKSLSESIQKESKSLLLSVKASTSDPQNSDIRNELLKSTRALGDALNNIIEVCSAAAPGHKDCNTALQILLDTSTRLDSVNDGATSLVSYGECIAKASESSKLLATLLGGVLSNARTANITKMSQELVVCAQSLASLTDGVSIAAYLIGISDPASVPAVSPAVEHLTLKQASFEIKETCAKLIDESNSQSQILELAATIAKHTSRLCNVCKIAGMNTMLNAAAKQKFVVLAKDIATKTSSVVATIKQLAVSLDDQSRNQAKQASGPLIEVIDTLIAYSNTPEFRGIPAKICAKAAQAQKPLIEANRSVINGAQDIVSTAKRICSNPANSEAQELMVAQSKILTDALHLVLLAVNNGAPGHKECHEAISKIIDFGSLVDAAIMDATVNNLQPSPSANKDNLVEALRALAGLTDVISRSATSDIANLPSSIEELPMSFKNCITLAIGVASNSIETTQQTIILNDTKAICELVQAFALSVQKNKGTKSEAGVAELASERSKVRTAVSKLIETIDGSRDKSGEFEKAVETIEGLIATFETKMPTEVNKTYEILSSEIDTLGKSFVEKVGDLLTKAKTSEKLREYAPIVSNLFETLVATSCAAAVVTKESKVKNDLLDSIRQLGGSTIRLLEGMRVASVRSAADNTSRLKLGQAGREVSSNISSLIAAAKEGSKGIVVCQDAVANINSIVSDLESLLVFAHAGHLDPVDTKDVFSKHKDLLLTAAKGLTETVKTFIGAVMGTQEEVVNAANQSVKSIEALKDYVRQGAVSITSGDKHMQQQLLQVTKTVAESLQGIISAAVSAIGKKADDPSMAVLGESVKHEFTAIAELIRITKFLADESSRGCRSLESAIQDVDEIVHILESDDPAEGTALPSEVASLSKQLATTSAALVSASNSGKQDDLVATSNALRKQIGDLARSAKAATENAPDDKRNTVLDSIKKAAMSTRSLLNRVKCVQEDGSPANKANLQTSAREVAFALNDVMSALEVLTPGGYVDLNDPNVIAERELLNAASVIEEASKKLAANAAKEEAAAAQSAEDSIGKSVDDRIIEAVKAIAVATGALVRSATGAQREIVAKSKIISKTQSKAYFSDGTWNEGLVSAAKLVASNVNDLCDVANEALKGQLDRERVIATAKSVSANTAQLITAAMVKSDPNSQGQIRLRAAGKSVATVTDQLVKVATEAMAFDDTEEMSQQSKKNVGLARERIMEMDAQVSILKMEKELEKARAKLAAVRRGRYENMRDTKGAT